MGRWCYGKGNFVEAKKHFTIASERSDKEAQYCLAELYRTGLGVEQDFEKAMQLYLQSAAQGHKGAQEILNKIRRECNNLPQRMGCKQALFLH